MAQQTDDNDYVCEAREGGGAMSSTEVNRGASVLR